jgi:mono/diheme cytochrome c family protein
MVGANSTTAIAWVIFLVTLIGWVVYLLANRKAARPELGAEVELAANRTPYFDDDELEGRRLERVQMLGLLFLVVLVIGLPLYWILEPGRQAGAVDQKNETFINWGSDLYATTAEGGFNCAGCHGANGGGGSAPYTVTDINTGEVRAVEWLAPALNSVLYRYDESEVEFILVYGRPFSPMSPWGLAGGGPLNDQQIETLIAKIKSFQLPAEGCSNEDPLCAGAAYDDNEGIVVSDIGADTRRRIDEAAQQAAQRLVDDGAYATTAEAMGEALFNLELNSGAYSCARCHTQGWSYGDPKVPGQGAFGWNLTGGAPAAHFPSEQDQIDFVKDGSEYGRRYGIQSQGSGRMPGFGTMLTDEQIKAIVEYTRGL